MFWAVGMYSTVPERLRSESIRSKTWATWSVIVPEIGKAPSNNGTRSFSAERQLAIGEPNKIVELRDKKFITLAHLEFELGAFRRIFITVADVAESAGLSHRLSGLPKNIFINGFSVIADNFARCEVQ